LFQGLYPPPRQDIDSDRVLTGDSAYKARSVSGTGNLPNRLRWPLFAWVGRRLAYYILRLPRITRLLSKVSLCDWVDYGRWCAHSCRLGDKCCRWSRRCKAFPSERHYGYLPGRYCSTIPPAAPNRRLGQAFLIPLFLVQPFGTGKLGFAFAPSKYPRTSPYTPLLPLDLVTFVWLSLLGITGIINITSYPGIFRAFDPSRAVLCALESCSCGCDFDDSLVFVRTRKYDSLAGILLAVTGCEAMFAKSVSWEIGVHRVD